MYSNDGAEMPAPDRMVHVVYADADGYLFDWDWVLEDPGAPGQPLDCYLRFDEPNSLAGDTRLDLPRDLRPGQFDRAQACYSNRGDCLVCYITGDESYATRINSDLTVFPRFGDDQYSGFKIKNLRRILQIDGSIVLADAPGLTVAVDSVLLATLKLNPKESVEIYSAVIRALHKSTSEPPKVQLPSPMAEALGAVV